MRNIHIYSFMSHGYDLAELQIRLLRKYLSPSKITIIQGSYGLHTALDCGHKKLDLNEDIGADRIVDSPDHTGYRQNIRFALKQAWVWDEFVLKQDEEIAVFMHGDLLPIEPIDMDSIVGESGAAGRGLDPSVDTVPRSVWTWMAYDVKKCKDKIRFPALVAPRVTDMGGDDISFNVSYQGYSMPEYKWHAKLGKMPKEYNSITGLWFEWCDPSWLHVDKMSNAYKTRNTWLSKMDLLRGICEPLFGESPDIIRDRSIVVDGALESVFDKFPPDPAPRNSLWHKYKIMEALPSYNTSPRSKVLNTVAKAAKSIFKTVVLRHDRTDQDQFTNRISICKACEFSKKKRNGDPFSCGPMLESMANPDIKTCGCILTRKARDKRETCPMGFWPEITE